MPLVSAASRSTRCCPKPRWSLCGFSSADHAFRRNASGCGGAIMTRTTTVFLFDLDGTLVDSVYEHVLAWREALDREGIDLSVWRIHRKIGMSGGLFTNMLLRETGLDITPELLDRLRRYHAEAYRQRAGRIRPLPGAREL